MSLVRFLFEAESHEMGNGALFAVMGPDEMLPALRSESGKSLPVPRRRSDRF